MAINKTLNKRTNTHGAMRNCIEYVLRQDKTNELFTCVTGSYCHDEINYDLVYRTFLEKKKVRDKDSGRMYAHNIISWHKDEQITLEQAIEFGKEFAENWFSGFQTLMAVHKDKDHIHCHLVQAVDEAYRKQKEAEKQLQSLKYQAEQNRKIAEKEVQKLKKRIRLQSEKINEIKFYCGIGYIAALVLSACLIKMCFL